MTTQDAVSTVVNCISLRASPESHTSHISQAVSSLITAGTADVCVVSSSGESIPANISLLCLASPFLRHLLSSVPCCISPTILLPDCSTHALNHLISIISNGFTTSHLGNGIFKDINEVMDMAKLMNITIADLSYEKGPGRSENKGVNRDRDEKDLDIEKNIEVKEEVFDDINFDQQMPVIESFESLETDQDFINEEEIIGTSEIASVSSLSKIPNNQESPAYICSVCHEMFSQKKKLKKHMDVHFKEDLFPCDKCGKVFKLMSTLKLHKLSHDNIPLPKVKETGKSLPTETSKEFCCPACPRTYARKATLNQHMNIHSELKPYKCPTCGKGFRNRLIRNNHSNDCVSVKDVETNVKNDNTEKELDYEHIFNEENPVVEHIKIKKEAHENIDKVNLDNKQEIDGGNDQFNFECKVCQERFTSRNSFDKHVINGCEKRYQCPFCSAKFNQKGNISRHVKRKHPDEKIEANNKSQVSIKPEENETNNSVLIQMCNYCSKAFLKETNLKIHIKRCKKRNKNIEDKSYLEQDPVKSLQKIGASSSKLDDVDFTCDECEEKFPLYKDLMKHIYLGICFKNQCPFCPKKFKKKEDLDWHTDIDHYVSDVE